MRARDFYPRHPDERGLQRIEVDSIARLDLDPFLTVDEVAMEMVEAPREPSEADREEYFRQMQHEREQLDKVRAEIRYDAWMRRKKRDA